MRAMDDKLKLTYEQLREAARIAAGLTPKQLLEIDEESRRTTNKTRRQKRLKGEWASFGEREHWAREKQREILGALRPLGLTDEKAEAFDAALADLRIDLGIVKAIQRLPTVADRNAALSRLQTAIDNVRNAAKDVRIESLQVGKERVGAVLPLEVHEWLAQAEEVSLKVAALRKQRLSVPGINGHRAWLIGQQIPALYKKVTGKRFTSTCAGPSMKFAHCVLDMLGEPDVSDDRIKKLFLAAAKGVVGKQKPSLALVAIHPQRLSPSAFAVVARHALMEMAIHG
jgi:hypothetical protein